jgi:cellulose synthase/poly-beta-1,6-N-acetylglucosamine synthase-like glycosyltransferase
MGLKKNQEGYSYKSFDELIIQIPCHNEARTLPETIQALPKSLPGIDQIETLVIDNGSTDDSARIASQAGANHIVQLPTKGLAGGVCRWPGRMSLSWRR